MKITNTFAFLAPILILAGCETYPEHRSTYGTYTTPSGSQVISSPDTSATTTYTPSYSSGVSQGAAGTKATRSSSDPLFFSHSPSHGGGQGVRQRICLR